MPDSRNYFLVKHGLDSLEALPNFIWRTDEKDEPRVFRRVKKGDRWISFAFTTSDSRERPVSQITGFYECTRESEFGELPRKARQISGCKKAWMIEGKHCGRQPEQPVGVPPIDELLGRTTFKGQMLVPINDRGEFERVRDYTLDHELDPSSLWQNRAFASGRQRDG